MLICSSVSNTKAAWVWSGVAATEAQYRPSSWEEEI